eukprot:Rhum_TRINITY_DN11963_c0_g1::Rhum_TRINITY_DN11963_c0_g1_i1::g.48199::m.48199
MHSSSAGAFVRQYPTSERETLRDMLVAIGYAELRKKSKAVAAGRPVALAEVRDVSLQATAAILLGDVYAICKKKLCAHTDTKPCVFDLKQCLQFLLVEQSSDACAGAAPQPTSVDRVDDFFSIAFLLQAMRGLSDTTRVNWKMLKQLVFGDDAADGGRGKVGATAAAAAALRSARAPLFAPPATCSPRAAAAAVPRAASPRTCVAPPQKQQPRTPPAPPSLTPRGALCGVFSESVRDARGHDVDLGPNPKLQRRRREAKEKSVALRAFGGASTESSETSDGVASAAAAVATRRAASAASKEAMSRRNLVASADNPIVEAFRASPARNHGSARRSRSGAAAAGPDDSRTSAAKRSRTMPASELEQPRRRGAGAAARQVPPPPPFSFAAASAGPSQGKPRVAHGARAHRAAFNVTPRCDGGGGSSGYLFTPDAFKGSRAPVASAARGLPARPKATPAPPAPEEISSTHSVAASSFLFTPDAFAKPAQGARDGPAGRSIAEDRREWAREQRREQPPPPPPPPAAPAASAASVPSASASPLVDVGVEQLKEIVKGVLDQMGVVSPPREPAAGAASSAAAAPIPMPIPMPMPPPVHTGAAQAGAAVPPPPAPMPPVPPPPYGEAAALSDVPPPGKEEDAGSSDSLFVSAAVDVTGALLAGDTPTSTHDTAPHDADAAEERGLGRGSEGEVSLQVTAEVQEITVTESLHVSAEVQEITTTVVTQTELDGQGLPSMQLPA